MKVRSTLSVFPFALLILLGMSGISCDSSTAPESTEPATQSSPAAVGCGNGYSCQNIQVLSHLSPSELLGERLNDIWGWTDPQTGKEYALVGLTDRLTFVDISTPEKPVVVGTLPESIDSEAGKSTVPSLHHDDEEGEGKSSWRDIKVYKNHAYVVSDAQPHGLQIFDLTRLRNVTDPPAIFTEDVHYEDFANAHNIAINRKSGYAYVVGSNRFGGGLYILDISSPQNPVLAGSHSDKTVGHTSPGYVHDTQCVMYNGPDSDYQGDEVCFNSSETHFVIADVSDKSNTKTIAKSSYAGNAYAHQGWLTEDHRYFLLDDELDERRTEGPTTTYIWDVQDLDNPKMIGKYEADFYAIDHNQYINGHYTYQSNYMAGLRILDITDIASGKLQEVAHFDANPANNQAKFDGIWSNYPYFESGVVIVSDISKGLFVLSPELE